MLQKTDLQQFNFRPAKDIEEIVCDQNLVARRVHDSGYEVLYSLGEFDREDRQIYLGRNPTTKENTRSIAAFLKHGSLFFDQIHTTDDFLVSDHYFVNHKWHGKKDIGVIDAISRSYVDVLSQEIFGFSARDWNTFLSFLTAFCRGYIPKENSIIRGFRLTRSVGNDSKCELSAAWIPAAFPYITITDEPQRYTLIDRFSISGVFKFSQLAWAGGFGKLKSEGYALAESLGPEYVSVVQRVCELRIPDRIILAAHMSKGRW